MKFWLPLTLALLILLFRGIESRADRVLQGAGIAENNIMFAYEYLDKYIQLCLAVQGCVDPGPQTVTLQEILAALPTERQQAGQILFKSQRQDGIFFIDGKIRVAKTATAVGSLIYFNLDQLYSLDSAGHLAGISIQTAVSLLVHEFGHHHGVVDHDWLDLLGHHVSKVLDGSIHSTMLSPNRPNIETTYISFNRAPDLQPYTQVLVSDGSALYDLGGSLFAGFRCPVREGIGSQLTELELWNFTWRGVNAPDPLLVGYAAPHCRWLKDDSLWSPAGLGVQVQVHLNWLPLLGWTLDAKAFSVRQVTCAEEPLLCNWDVVSASHRFIFGPQLRKHNAQPKDLL